MTLSDKSHEADKLHEECAVFGIHGSARAAPDIGYGLHALQHRGQEATGILTSHGGEFYAHRAQGLVGDALDPDSGVYDRLIGSVGIGHNRYSTAGPSSQDNIQPLEATLDIGKVGLAHNGNITNAKKLRSESIHDGGVFQSSSDTEVILHLISKARGTFTDRLKEAMKQIMGAYSLVLVTGGKLIGVRDPNGFRPLVLGKLDGSWILSSETCALDLLGAEFVRDIEPGEILIIDENGLHSEKPFPKSPAHFCLFEYIYFARPDSVIDGRSVYETRKKIGRILAREHPVDADVVVPIPDSGVPGAIGYAEESGLPFQYGIIRNHYVGRTFIKPSAEGRRQDVSLKHNANTVVLKDKRVVLIDDSVVRGTTSRRIIQMVRRAGAREVHLCITSPPITHGCYYGVDTPHRKDLMAAKHDDKPVAEMVKLMAEELGVDSLGFISLGGLYQSLSKEEAPAIDIKTPISAKPACSSATKKGGFCDACFTGNYPVRLVDESPTEPEQIQSSLFSQLEEQSP